MNVVLRYCCYYLDNLSGMSSTKKLMLIKIYYHRHAALIVGYNLAPIKLLELSLFYGSLRPLIQKVASLAIEVTTSTENEVRKSIVYLCLLNLTSSYMRKYTCKASLSMWKMRFLF